MVVGRSLGPRDDIEDLAAFAREQLAQTREITSPSVRSAVDVTIAGMPAHEIVADATTWGGRAVTVYQALAFDRRFYYLAQGFVAPDGEARFLPQFEAIARSLEPRR